MSRLSSERVRIKMGWVVACCAAGALALGACGSEPGNNTGGAGTSGAAGTGTGAAGTGAAGTGAAGTGAAGTGAAGTGAAGTGAAGTGAAGTGAAGTGAAGTGAAGTGAAGTGAAGTGAAGTGAAGTGAAGTGAAGAGAAGTGAAGAGAAGTGAAGTGAAGTPGPFALTSTAFTAGMEIPLLHKCPANKPAGMNQSPPLSWTPGPAGTMSYAVTLNHVASNSAHWAIWDIPAGTTSLPLNVEHALMPSVPAGAKQTHHAGFDQFTGDGYLGPCPQAVNSRQMYRYTVWAIGVASITGATTSSTTAAAQTAIKNAALSSPGAPAECGGKACASLTGTQIQQP
jgi:phosphatidylethanolamine-binding protein (PEBP) family uncharacterized protein